MANSKYKTRSGAVFVLKLDVTPMKLGYGLHKVEAHPAADDAGGIAASVVAFEYPAAVALRHAESTIVYHDRCPRFLLETAHCNRFVARRILDRIGQEIADRLA